MKVTLYTREHGSRRYQKHNPKKIYAARTIWVLRYGRTFETIKANSLSETTMLRIRRQMELDGGWRPQRMEKPETVTVLMLDKAKDAYPCIDSREKPASIGILLPDHLKC
jgi:hypothetical protein